MPLSAWLVAGCLLIPQPVLAQDAAPPAEKSQTRTQGETTMKELARVFVSELLLISPGTGKFPAEFRFGDPETSEPRAVAMKQPFRIARYEVPQNLYEAVMGENPSRWKGPRNSVEMMTWEEANEFCRRLTGTLRELNLIGAGEVVRLPTEVEWEYCCRAGTTTRYSFGDSAQAPGDTGKQARLLDPYAWHTGNAAGNDPPVGALKPNPWGLYDVHGYLWEFVGDDAGTDANRSQSDQCVIRGGSWKDLYSLLQSSTRRHFSRKGRDDAVGLRCVVTVSADKQPAQNSSR